MRVIVKGGVWRNTEDEILKAAVMKYGKNQWSRIASLLSRKSAKQCKERWYSWLDPSIKKTEWSREEEEKLLHLAKIFPTQWPTIAPLVGRTPAQCLQQYEKLLSAAQGTEEDSDLKKLRPGEVDVNAAQKPARPDPVDMDEDEKEMLSEARARMANTVGKKAKRKAREKQMQEARRLAAFQRKRELRAAGIDIGDPFFSKKRGMDYNAEIPFQKREPKGFYDTYEEKELNKERKVFRSLSLKDIEGESRDEEEKQERKKDKEFLEKKRNQNIPDALNQLNKQQTKRSKLMLPIPQVSDAELEEIIKMGHISEQAKDLLDDIIETSDLVEDYLVAPSTSHPSRTPMIKKEDDKLIQDAKYLIALQKQQTPLLAGTEGYTPIADFDDKIETPMRQLVQTPNTVLRTPSRTSESGNTPIKSERGLNFTPLQNSNKEDQKELLFSSKTLFESLKRLPEPKNDYELLAPEITEEDENENEKFIEDECELQASLEKKRIEEGFFRLHSFLSFKKTKEKKKFINCSSVVKKNLPRPIFVNKSFSKKTENVKVDSLQEADFLINKEIFELQMFDCSQFPLEKSKMNIRNYEIEFFTETELENAKQILHEEIEAVQKGMNHNKLDLQSYSSLWQEIIDEITYIPSQNKFGRISLTQPSEIINAMETEYQFIVKSLSKDGYKQASRLDNKIKLLVSGYENKELLLKNEINNVSKKIKLTETELKCYNALRSSEMVAIKHRIESLEREVQEQQSIEDELQDKYQCLKNTLINT